MTVTERIKNILKHSKAARNSDTELLVIYMQKSGMDLSARQVDIFRDMPSTETIRRVRQKLQESGQYEADSSVKKQRKIKSLEVTQVIPVVSPDGLERVLDRVVLPWGQ
jgi:DNA-binding transcriptional regulator WhiA